MINLGQVNLGKIDPNNQMKTLSVITLKGFHCTLPDQTSVTPSHTTALKHCSSIGFKFKSNLIFLNFFHSRKLHCVARSKVI